MASLTLENSIVDERYEVRRRLSHGSYAEIYEAFDLHRDRRPVIIKALNTHLQGTPDPELERTLVENFQNEALALDAVRHANVVRRLGHGTAADLAGVPFHYLVLEYMAGGDLLSRCRRRPLDLGEALLYFRQVCEALAEAHAREVIHRDIKPNNLLLSADGSTIKIIDFGVAKMSTGPDEEVTRVGTDVYAPPEHNPNTTDLNVREPLTPSADVYSLAKTIYAAMTGHGPREFARRPIESLPPTLQRQPWGPRLLEILRRATATRPTDRYPSVAAFWDDFSTLASFLEPAGDDEDDATHVRPRTKLRRSGDLPAAAPAPEFEPNLASSMVVPGGAPRIVVELAEPAPPPAPAPPPTPPARRQGPRPPAQQETYSYRDDLRDLVGSGWRLRAFVGAIVLVLLASVAGVYYEVHRYVRLRSMPQGKVTAQRINLRDQPSSDPSRIIGELPQDTRVLVLDRDDSGRWLYVEVLEWGGPMETEQPNRGWVSAQLVAVDD
jgi:serine/threonine protein kinase